MPVRCDEFNQVCVITVEGDLTGDNSIAFRTIVDDHIERKHVIDFIVDLEKCSFIDSEGLELLLDLKHRCDEMHGQAKLVGVDENCAKILEITRLEHRFDRQADLAAALKMMR